MVDPMTENVSLRRVEEADLPIFFEQQLDPDAARMAAFPSRDREAFMAHWVKSLTNRSVTLRTILHDGEVAGNIVCWEDAGERRVGYWLGKKCWSRGIATAALSQFLDVVASRPLFARVAKHNLASIRVLEKCGFTVIDEDTFAGPDGEEGEEYILKLRETENDGVD